MFDPTEKIKSNLDNHANQLNENNDAYYQSRGFFGKPKEELEEDNFDTFDWSSQY